MVPPLHLPNWYYGLFTEFVNLVKGVPLVHFLEGRDSPQISQK
jgi:hypothetical protein